MFTLASPWNFTVNGQRVTDNGLMFHALTNNKISFSPLLKKRDLKLWKCFIYPPFLKGEFKGGFQKKQISLYPSLEKRDFLSEIIFIIPLDKGGIRGIFCCSTALLLFCSTAL